MAITLFAIGFWIALGLWFWFLKSRLGNDGGMSVFFISGIIAGLVVAAGDVIVLRWYFGNIPPYFWGQYVTWYHCIIWVLPQVIAAGIIFARDEDNYDVWLL